MKRIFYIIIFLVSSSVCFSQVSDQTKNKIRVKFLKAQKNYEGGNFSEAIKNIKEIESLLGGTKNPTAQNLKVKSLIGAGEYKTAKKELNILYKLNPSSGILQDIASYEGKINSGIQAEIKRKENARLAEIKRNEKLREKRRRDSISRVRQAEKILRDDSNKRKAGKEIEEYIISQYELFRDKFNVKNGLFVMNDKEINNIKYKWFPSEYGYKSKNYFLIAKYDLRYNTYKILNRKDFSTIRGGDHRISNFKANGSFEIKILNSGIIVFKNERKLNGKDYDYTAVNLNSKSYVNSFTPIEVYEGGNILIDEHSSYYVLISKDLNKTIIERIDLTYEFKNNYQFFTKWGPQESGILNPKGEIEGIVSGHYTISRRGYPNNGQFSEGLLSVYPKYSKKHQCGYINKKFEFIIPLKNYEWCGPFENGKAKLKKKWNSKKYILIDKKGNRLKK